MFPLSWIRAIDNELQNDDSLLLLRLSISPQVPRHKPLTHLCHPLSSQLTLISSQQKRFVFTLTSSSDKLSPESARDSTITMFSTPVPSPLSSPRPFSPVP